MRSESRCEKAYVPDVDHHRSAIFLLNYFAPKKPPKTLASRMSREALRRFPLQHAFYLQQQLVPTNNMVERMRAYGEHRELIDNGYCDVALPETDAIYMRTMPEVVKRAFADVMIDYSVLWDTAFVFYTDDHPEDEHIERLATTYSTSQQREIMALHTDVEQRAEHLSHKYEPLFTTRDELQRKWAKTFITSEIFRHIAPMNTELALELAV